MKTLPVLDFPNFAPSICFICESAPPGAVYVNTMREFAPQFHTHLSGRKYVCSDCITDFAHHVGVFDVERERHQIALNAAMEQIEELEARVDAYEHLDAAIARLRPLVPEPPATEGSSQVGTLSDPTDPDGSAMNPGTPGEDSRPPKPKPGNARTRKA